MPGSVGTNGHPMCLDFYPGTGAAGDPVRIYSCHQQKTGEITTQIWRPIQAQFRSTSGRCLGSDTNFGAPGRLVLVNCNAASINNDLFDWSN
jgi:hypothetical protein